MCCFCWLLTYVIVPKDKNIMFTILECLLANKNFWRGVTKRTLGSVLDIDTWTNLFIKLKNCAVIVIVCLGLPRYSPRNYFHSSVSPSSSLQRLVPMAFVIQLFLYRKQDFLSNEKIPRAIERKITQLQKSDDVDFKNTSLYLMIKGEFFFPGEVINILWLCLARTPFCFERR